MSTRVPRKDAEFIAWALNIYQKCVTNATEWKLENAKLQELGQYVNAAKNAYAANVNKEDRSLKITETKRKTFAALRAYLALFTPTLTANMNIGNDELEAMGVHSREHHSYRPIPVAPHAPALKVISGEHHEVNAYASIAQLGGVTSYLKSSDFYGICLRTHMEGDETWREQNYTRLHVALVFNEEHVGKRLSLSAAWINPRLERGPWSDTVTVIIN
jgi:hypothetical protein